MCLPDYHVRLLLSIRLSLYPTPTPEGPSVNEVRILMKPFSVAGTGFVLPYEGLRMPPECMSLYILVFLAPSILNDGRFLNIF
jgi:hypothetical protein